ncbi:MAG: endonuclease MutS2 [Acidobacteriota bacterium]
MCYSLNTLEFRRLLEIVAGGAQTPMGQGRILELEPLSGRAELENELAAVSEMIFLNEERQISFSFSGLDEIDDAIAVLGIRSASLNAGSLREVAALVGRALFVRSTLQPESESVPHLWRSIEPLPNVLLGSIQKINRLILPGGEIDDSASPELGRIRREIAAQRNRLTRSLESLMRGAGDAIQDAIVTIRNDRFVIPVKSDFRGKIAGVAHGFSSSGATVFMEPLDAIDANNELQNIRSAEEREIARILSCLTEELREHLPAIKTAVEAVIKLDVVKAKVEFARKFKAVVPEISEDDTLELTEARHPVLEETLKNVGTSGDETSPEIIPNSFSLTRESPVMIISGANAGGKTVVLKTAGLLSLMAVSGLPVTAKQARIPFYRSVLADIGDHQSLAANLSTFSSHMSNIAGMINECVSPSLVLLDEVGTGTDPDEGSALGVAIVDHFRRKCSAQVIASTHYRGLKIYAANDPNVINASVEFDEKTLQPTYRLLIGLAGASSGIEIARRFGISSEVIEESRHNLDSSAHEAAAFLQKLQSETKLAGDLRIALEEERDAVAMKYASLEIEAGKREKQRQKEFEHELAKTVEDFDRQSKSFVRSLEDKALKNRLEKERTARKAELNRSVLAKAVRSGPAGSGVDVNGAEEHTVISKPLTIGSHVITSFGSRGVIEKLDKDSAEVLVGGMRLREKVANLQHVAVLPPNIGKGRSPVSSGLSKPIDSPDAAAELNLIGKTTAEADYELDRFIDEAYMGSVPRVRIIHGFGTGALKNFVHHFLKNHDLVERFAFAPSDQGGNGATIAELKV